jgi:hypothetical protein
MEIDNVFEIMIDIFFQSIFFLEMHQNNVFFKKKLFLTSSYQNNPKIQKNINLK